MALSTNRGACTEEQPVLLRTNPPHLDGDSFDVPFDLRPEDEDEIAKVDLFLAEGCGCSRSKKHGCMKQFLREFVMEYRNECFHLLSVSPEGFNLMLGGFYNSNKKTENGVRTARWMIHGTRVCAKFFAFIHGIGTTKLHNIVQNVNEFGLLGLSSGRKRRNEPARSEKTLEGIKAVKDYLEVRMVNDAIALPGKCPSHREYKAARFPSHFTKSSLYEDYKKACQARGDEKIISFPTFCSYWDLGCPDIGIMGKSSDLCDKCKANQEILGKLVSMEDGEEKERLRTGELRGFLEHLDHVATERADYNKAVQEAKAAFIDNPQAPKKVIKCIDYAQARPAPYFSGQPGTLHFKSQRLAQLFGITSEGDGKNTLYLFDEEELNSIGKGGCSVVSLLFHYLRNHLENCEELRIQADNCSGQNKNWIMTAFIGWLVWTGQLPDTTLAFLVECHGKFSVDRAFGVYSQKFSRQERIECIQDMVALCDELPSFSGILVNDYTKENGRNVNWFMFDHFFKAFFNKVPSIKRYHKFHYERDTPGVIFIQEWSNSPIEAVSIYKKNVAELPREITSAYIPQHVPLAPARAWYIYDNLRDYCSTEEKKNMLAPLPLVPRPTSNSEEARMYRLPRSNNVQNEPNSNVRYFAINRVTMDDLLGPEQEFPGDESEVGEDKDDDDCVEPVTSPMSQLDLGFTAPTHLLPEEDDKGTSMEIESSEPVWSDAESVEASGSEDDDQTTSEYANTGSASIGGARRRTRCGTCEPCLLYNAHMNGEMPRDTSKLERSKRFKCGVCRRCKTKHKVCRNILCAKLQ